MKRVLPRCLVVVVSGILIGVLSAAPALADERIPLTADPVSLPKGKYCEGFDVLITFQDFNQYIVQSTTAPDGTQTFHITGRARATVTNEDTGESVSFNISGPGTLVINPDGSFSGDLSGANLLYTARKDLQNFPAVPTISYTTGNVTFAADKRGQTTSYTLAGGARQTDVCAVLAP